jgi:hypothetical protein
MLVFPDGEIEYSMSMKCPACHLSARFASEAVLLFRLNAKTYLP